MWCEWKLPTLRIDDHDEMQAPSVPFGQVERTRNLPHGEPLQRKDRGRCRPFCTWSLRNARVRGAQAASRRWTCNRFHRHRGSRLGGRRTPGDNNVQRSDARFLLWILVADGYRNDWPSIVAGYRMAGREFASETPCMTSCLQIYSETARRFLCNSLPSVDWYIHSCSAAGRPMLLKGELPFLACPR